MRMSKPRRQGWPVSPELGDWLIYCFEATRRAMAVSVMAGIPALKDLSADLKRRMDQAVATFQANLASTRTGRASVHMLDQVKADYYGTNMPINHPAQLPPPEPQPPLI